MSTNMDPSKTRVELLQLAQDTNNAVNQLWAKGEFDLRSVGAVLDQLAKANSRALRELAGLFREPEQVEGIAGPVVQDFLPEPEREAVTVERIEEIVDGLNAFVVYRYQAVRELAYGVVYSHSVADADLNLAEAIAWALSQPEVRSVFDQGDNKEASVTLSDGTVIEWDPDAKEWAPVFADEPAEVSA